MNIEYESEICRYCPYTDYGVEPNSYVTGSGLFIACEGCCCEQALDNYNTENDERLTLEDAF